MRIILASSSEFRRQLLARLMLPFEVAAPDTDETPLANETAEVLVERLAVAKAKSLVERYPQALIIGSDQVAVHEGVIVGKPHNHTHAVEQLMTASGKTIILYTGLALINTANGRIQKEVLPYRVTFRKLTREVVERYLKKEQPYSCAGSVRSEGLGIALLKRFQGDDPNALIGLPLIRLVRMLEREGIQVV